MPSVRCVSRTLVSVTALWFSVAPGVMADTALELASAMDIPGSSIVSATFLHLADNSAAKVRFNWGQSPSIAGPTLAVFSTGVAADVDDPGYVAPRNGTAFTNTVANPVAGELSCGGEDPPSVWDYTELEVVLNVPTNATGFRFTFNFFSAEYPDNVCMAFNDRFMVRLTSQAFNGNVAFDSMDNPVSVNTVYFAVTDCCELIGTGMDQIIPWGAAIGWQTLTAPAVPGETITVRISIHDAGDQNLDSVAVMDAFEWIIPALVVEPRDIVADENRPFEGPLATFTDSTAGAAVEDYSAKADWGDGTVSNALVVTNTSGGFYVVGATTYLMGGDYSVQGSLTNTVSGIATNFSLTAVVRPALGLDTAGQTAQLSWFTTASNYILHYSPDPTSLWSEINAPAVTNGNRNLVTDPMTNDVRLYRLERP